MNLSKRELTTLVLMVHIFPTRTTGLAILEDGSFLNFYPQKSLCFQEFFKIRSVICLHREEPIQRSFRFMAKVNVLQINLKLITVWADSLEKTN